MIGAWFYAVPLLKATAARTRRSLLALPAMDRHIGIGTGHRKRSLVGGRVSRLLTLQYSLERWRLINWLCKLVACWAGCPRPYRPGRSIGPTTNVGAAFKGSSGTLDEPHINPDRLCGM